MRNLHRSLSTARQSGGFTLVELLVVIGIIAILAGVALGPISSGIRQAKESAAMQTCRTLALAEFQYSNDNSTYPDGADAGALCNAMFTGNYVTDPSVFRISGSQAVPPATAGTIVKANVSYDFMGMNGTGTPAQSGILVSAPDILPVVWSPDGEVVAPSGSAGETFTPSTGFFGSDGIAVAYKSNNAFFRTPAKTGSTFPTVGKVLFVDEGVSVAPPTGDSWGLRIGADQ